MERNPDKEMQKFSKIVKAALAQPLTSADEEARDAEKRDEILRLFSTKARLPKRKAAAEAEQRRLEEEVRAKREADARRADADASLRRLTQRREAQLARLQKASARVAAESAAADAMDAKLSAAKSAALVGGVEPAELAQRTQLVHSLLDFLCVRLAHDAAPESPAVSGVAYRPSDLSLKAFEVKQEGKSSREVGAGIWAAVSALHGE